GRHNLLCQYALHRCELVADDSRALELQSAGGFLHTSLQQRRDFIVTPFEHLDGRGEILRVTFARDQPDTRRRASPDLMLQAGTTAVGKKAVAAIPDAEQLLQLSQCVLHRPGVREGPEVAPWGRTRAAIESQARELVIVLYLDVRKALVIAQNDIE